SRSTSLRSTRCTRNEGERHPAAVPSPRGPSGRWLVPEVYRREVLQPSSGRDAFAASFSSAARFAAHSAGLIHTPPVRKIALLPTVVKLHSVAADAGAAVSGTG